MKSGMTFARKTTWRSSLNLEYLTEISRWKASARRQTRRRFEKTQALGICRLRLEGNTSVRFARSGFLHHLILVNEETKVLPTTVHFKGMPACC